MESFLLELLNRSIAASWLILAVLLLRLLLKNAPKWSRMLLWAMLGLRLLMPEMPASSISLIPSTQTLPENILMTDTPSINSGISYLNSIVNPVLQETMAPTLGASANPMQLLTFVLSLIWLLGIAAMGTYVLISSLRLKKKLEESLQAENGVYICDRIDTPFLFGIFQPKIYLPSGLSPEDTQYVLAHERAHLRGLDHIWKPLGFCILVLHWFNPLVWLSYRLFCRDMELSCDERVIRQLGSESKKPYSQALLRCSSSAKFLACPLAFGEGSVKARIVSVLHYKKPALWLLILSVIVVAVTAVCFLTDPKQTQEHTITEAYAYPVLPGTQEWNELDSLQEKIHACYVDPALMGRMSTEALVETVLNYPLLINIYAFDTIEMGIESVSNYFAGIGILAQREDAVAVLNACAEAYADSFQGAVCSTLVEYFSGAQWSQSIFLDKTVLAQLRSKYPENFDLDTTEGLEVYVWQMAPESYCCLLLPGTNHLQVPGNLDRKVHASLSEMQMILYSYGISPEQISVIPITVPYSSYYYDIDAEYIENLRTQLLVYYYLD